MLASRDGFLGFIGKYEVFGERARRARRGRAKEGERARRARHGRAKTYISEPVPNQEDQIIYSRGKHSLELDLKSEHKNNYKGGDGSSETKK